MNIIDTSLWIEFFAGNPLDESIVNAIIYATAVLWGADLYTQDKHFENLDHVYYFSKYAE